MVAKLLAAFFLAASPLGVTGSSVFLHTPVLHFDDEPVAQTKKTSTEVAVDALEKAVQAARTVVPVSVVPVVAKAAPAKAVPVRAAVVKAAPKVAVAAAAVKAAPKTDADAAAVTQLHAQLTKVSSGLEQMLVAKSGALAKTKVADTMTKFNEVLKGVLKATEKPKDMKKALKQLQDSQDGVRNLAQDITNAQVKLMMEDEEQQASLLLGILMQKQGEPMSKQLEVMKNSEFAKLKVVVAVLAKKDMKTPLYQQVASYLDAKSPKKAQVVKAKVSEEKSLKAPEVPEKLQARKDGKPDVTPIVLALKKHLQSMEENEKHMEKHHADEMKEFDRVAKEKKNATKAVVSHLKQMRRSEERLFLKQSAIGKHDISTMKEAVSAIEKGDMSALEKAQGALNQSLKAAQATSGKFLVFIELVHRSQSLDCPYCAAQCVDKCHNEGKSYTVCLTDCADAGK